MDWINRKVFWTAIIGGCTLAGACFAPWLDKSLLATAILAFLTGVCGILEKIFVGDAVVAENRATLRAMRNLYQKGQ